MKTSIFLSVFLLILVGGCKKDENNVTDPPSQQNTVTDIDGNTYKTVKIGTQVWMVENLRVTKYRNGDAIPNITDDTAWQNAYSSNTPGAYCNYDNSPSNGNTYGRLYNHYAVVDSRNIAPLGWHVPTDEDWATLISYLGSASIVGGNMKESGLSHWSSPNTSADNTSGFTALPGGRRDFTHDAYLTAYFSSIGNEGSWWSSSTKTPNRASCSLFYNSREARTTYYSSIVGLSVRCIKD